MRCYHFFIFEVIAESVNLVTDVKIEQKIIITMMENNYFLKKLTSKHTDQKERCACNYAIARNHSHKKHSLETRAVLIEIFVMLKFTEWPKTPGMTSKKTLLSLKGISRFCANLDETKADMDQFTKRWN